MSELRQKIPSVTRVLLTIHENPDDTRLGECEPVVYESVSCYVNSNHILKYTVVEYSCRSKSYPHTLVYFNPCSLFIGRQGSVN